MKRDCQPEPGELLEDELLIRADKNPNTTGGQALFGDAPPHFPDGTDLVLVWGEGCDFASLPPQARMIFLNPTSQPENGHADVFIPASIQTERNGHYTNFEGARQRVRSPASRSGNLASTPRTLFRRCAALARGHP
ncbi:MAG: hypothetical protein IPF50_02965 [Proteobacteria bacterium]|nr:hypothetical protein [Pseudomonadota bacterium]